MQAQKEIDRQSILSYKEEVRTQYELAMKTGKQSDVDKANKMYGVLMYKGNQYMQEYQEPIDIILK